MIRYVFSAGTYVPSYIMYNAHQSTEDAAGDRTLTCLVFLSLTFVGVVMRLSLCLVPSLSASDQSRLQTTLYPLHTLNGTLKFYFRL